VSTYQPETQDQVVITNCVISGNSSTWRGGGVYLSGSGARVHNSTIRENHSAGSGGGIYIFGNPAEPTSTFPIVRNSLIVGNAALDGGGVYLQNTDARIFNSTIVDNTAEGQGGGIYSYQNRGLTGLAPELQKPVLIVNSIVARNNAAEGTALYHSTGNYFDTPGNAPLPPGFHQLGLP
jgi:hypothetical protein